MIWLSAEISPRFVVQIGDQPHGANIFGLHIGRSGRGGKGESFSLIKRMQANINAQKAGLLCQMHTSGLSTREGLALTVHDTYKENGEEVLGVNDKRLFLVESEFSQVLEQGKRGGNTLLPALRDCWDYGASLKPLTKTSKISATHLHIGLLGNITPTLMMRCGEV